MFKVVQKNIDGRLVSINVIVMVMICYMEFDVVQVVNVVIVMNQFLGLIY